MHSAQKRPHSGLQGTQTTGCRFLPHRLSRAGSCSGSDAIEAPSAYECSHVHVVKGRLVTWPIQATTPRDQNNLIITSSALSVARATVTSACVNKNQSLSVLVPSSHLAPFPLALVAYRSSLVQHT